MIKYYFLQFHEVLRNKKAESDKCILKRKDPFNLIVELLFRRTIRYINHSNVYLTSFYYLFGDKNKPEPLILPSHKEHCYS